MASLDFDSTVVPPEDAKKAVMLFAEGIEGEDTKSTARRMVESIWSTGSISTKADGDDSPMFYVINFADSMGFAIAGADKRLPPIIFFSESGSFNESDAITDSGFSIMLSRIETECRMLLNKPVYGEEGRIWSYSDYKSYMNFGRDSNFDPDSCDIYWTIYQTSSPVGTHVGCSWKQGHPFNDECPVIDGIHAKAGCVPIAVAQIMYFHKKNTTYSNYYYNWNVMKDIIDANSEPSSTNKWLMVQNLIVDLGDNNNLDVDYGSEGSSAYYSNIKPTFENFSYQNGGSISPYNYSTIASEISLNNPVILTGSRIDSVFFVSGVPTDTTYVGHAWVADQTMHTLWRMWVVRKSTHHLEYSTIVNRDFVYCNWGWGPSFNGYFLSSVFDADHPYSFATKSIIDTLAITEHFYKYSLQQVTGIRP